MEYRCPYCKTVVIGSAPIKAAMEDKGFCPSCGEMFDKQGNILKKEKNIPKKKIWQL